MEMAYTNFRFVYHITVQVFGLQSNDFPKVFPVTVVKNPWKHNEVESLSLDKLADLDIDQPHAISLNRNHPYIMMLTL